MFATMALPQKVVKEALMRIGIPKGSNGIFEKRGFVYFLRAKDGSGPIKIGFSVHLESRVKSVSSSIKKDLEIIGILEGYMSDEAWTHQKFINHRLDGEWFSPVEEIISFAKSVINFPRRAYHPQYVMALLFYELIEEGYSPSVISKASDTSESNLRNIMRKWNFPVNNNVKVRYRRNVRDCVISIRNMLKRAETYEQIKVFFPKIEEKYLAYSD
jgi:hypothetical protein